jgi:hypothetical protein
MPNFTNIRPVEAELLHVDGHTDGRTDGHEKAQSRFSQFCGSVRQKKVYLKVREDERETERKG